MLDLRQLGNLIAELHTRDLLRLETLPRYEAASDDEDYRRYLAMEHEPNAAGKRAWLDRLRKDTAAGRRWRRVHAVTLPLSDYIRYECEWGYAYNVAAGEDVRIFVAAEPELRAIASFGDLFVIDGEHVISSHYDHVGRFIGAEVVSEQHQVDACQALAGLIWHSAIPFSEWWAAHPEFHRDRAA